MSIIVACEFCLFHFSSIGFGQAGRANDTICAPLADAAGQYYNSMKFCEC